MKILTISLLCVVCFFMGITAFTQSDVDLDEIKNRIRYEGVTLYDLETAAWCATGIVLEKYNNDFIRGHLAYKEDDNFKTIFFNYGAGDTVHVLYTFTFDYPIKPETTVVVDTERAPTAHEDLLLFIREKMILDIEKDTGFYKYFPDFMYNMGIIENETGFRVYTFSRIMADGYIPLGNDYLIQFNSAGDLLSREVLHEDIIRVPVKADIKDDLYFGTQHNHVEDEQEFITPTDISTLLHHLSIVKWEHHIVNSPRYKCVFNIKTRYLEITEN